ncbi:MAG: SRPBCC family protein [Crocinitomicaceae bacterium]
MPKTYVNRSIYIDAPVSQVFPLLNNFNQWTEWSPWAILEKEASVSVAPDGKYFDWKGTRIGAGEMKITSEKANQWIHADLTFLKPWKSQAKIAYSLEEKNNGTAVTWEMKSSLPFFMFWMKNMMQNMIGMDFDRGLNMLKDLVEKGTVPCKLDLEKRAIFDSKHFIGYRSTSPMGKMSNVMSEKIPLIKTFIAKNNLKASGEMVSIYHKWDLKNMTTNFTTGAFVDAVPQNLATGMTAGKIESTPVNLVRLTGNYNHLANAWSMQMMMQRNKEFKHNTKQDPFEVYKNSPFNTAQEDLITEVMFPVK